MKYIAGMLSSALLASVVPNVALADWQSALAALAAETQIKDLHRPQDYSLYVGMLDDGTRRDGYAMYVCEVLREHRVTAPTPRNEILVNIIDIVRVVQDGEFRRLGQHWCKL